MSNFESIIADLNDQYLFDEPINISVFFEKNGNKKLLKLLKQHYKETYNPTDRLVLYFDTDMYMYANCPGALINALQQYITEIDISHCFILIVSSENIVKQDLETVRAMYSTDLEAIQHIQCSDIPVNTQHIQLSSDTLCIKPWIHLYVGTDGNVLPCCVADNTKPVSSINNGTIVEVANTDKFRAVRKSMLEHKRPIECSICYELEAKGIKSNREFSNHKWKNKFNLLDDANKDGSVDSFKTVSVDFRLSNTCNFKCRICTGYASSRIQQEEKNHNIIDVEYNTLNVSERDKALAKIIPCLVDAEEIYFAGGEPLIIKEHYKILDHLLSINKHDMSLRYNSNLSKLTYKDKSIITYWKQFKNIELGISIDEMGVPAEYSRSGTVWNVIEDNVRTIKRECPHININITSTFSIYSAFNLIKFQQTWIEMKLVKHTHMVFQILTEPSYTSVQILPTTYKNMLIKRINKHIMFLHTYNSSELIAMWESAIIYINANDSSYNLHKFFNYNDALDKCRDENFEDCYPEYINLRNYS